MVQKSQKHVTVVFKSENTDDVIMVGGRACGKTAAMKQWITDHKPQSFTVQHSDGTSEKVFSKHDDSDVHISLAPPETLNGQIIGYDFADGPDVTVEWEYRDGKPYRMLSVSPVIKNKSRANGK